MPLNHATGEPIVGLDPVIRVVPVEKYKNLPRLTTTVREEVGKKFKREVEVKRPIWQAAIGAAQIEFFKMGADPTYLKCDVLCQEHVRAGVVSFVFAAMVGEQERLVVASYSLEPQQIADLKVINLWQDLRVN